MNVTQETLKDTQTIRLAGRFDFNSYKEFRSAYGKGLDDAAVRKIEVDFSGVDYLDSSALGMLLLLRERAQAGKKSVTLANCRGVVRQVLEVANFQTVFNMR